MQPACRAMLRPQSHATAGSHASHELQHCKALHILTLLCVEWCASSCCAGTYKLHAPAGRHISLAMKPYRIQVRCTMHKYGADAYVGVCMQNAVCAAMLRSCAILICAAVLQGFLYVLDCYGKTVEGWPLQMGEIQAQVAVSDIDGDGQVELVAMDTRGNVAAFTPKAQERWERHVGSLVAQVGCYITRDVMHPPFIKCSHQSPPDTCWMTRACYPGTRTVLEFPAKACILLSAAFACPVA